ncbi:MAG: hypothetical protein JXA13_02370 [Anaerolineales bacterium]|nr:hypothetical protein [Anaerolineales bacterium]
MFAVMLVLDDPERLDEVLDAWEKAGLRGATIIDSTGWQRRRIRRGLLGARFNFAALEASGRIEHHNTLFVIVRDRDMVQETITATESIVGDLDGPNTGIIAAWPLDIVKGLPPLNGQEGKETN